MAKINDILNEDWSVHDHGEVEDAMKQKLSEMEEGIESAGQVNEIVMNGQHFTPENKVIDLGTVITDVSDKVDKVQGKDLSSNDYTTQEKNKLAGLNNYDDTSLQAAITSLRNALNALIGGTDVQGAIDTFNEVVAFLDNISSSDTLAAKLAALVPQSRTINGKPLSSNVTIGMSDIQGLVDAINNAGSGAVSVTTNQDGTFVIHVGETDYTINLNHTHENMAKLVVCEESGLPSTLDEGTIYAVVDDNLYPTEITKLVIRGLEFVGGSGSSTPLYDAEIEYLQSTGTQFINISTYTSSNFECEIKAELTENQGIFDTIIGACEDVSNEIYSVPLAIKNTGEFYAQFKGNFAAKSATATGLHVFRSSLINNVITINVDGSSATLNLGNQRGSITNFNLFLFARNMANVADRFAKAKIYYCKIWNNGSLVCDFVPVRVGQVGYMYDRVRNRLFGNRGTGSFTLGNDKQ